MITGIALHSFSHLYFFVGCVQPRWSRGNVWVSGPFRKNCTLKCAFLPRFSTKPNLNLAFVPKTRKLIFNKHLRPRVSDVAVEVRGVLPHSCATGVPSICH